MRFASEPGISTRKMPLRVRRTGLFDAPKTGPRGRIRWDERLGVRISFCAHETTHPRHPGDIGDIGDISRKPLKMQGFLNVRTGDISGDIFLDGDFHAQDALACAPHRAIRCAKNRPSGAHSMGRAPGDPGERPDRTFARKTPHACALPGVSMLSGNPYRQDSARSRCSEWLAPLLVVPANANRFRFGNSSAFPNRRHGDHWRR